MSNFINLFPFLVAQTKMDSNQISWELWLLRSRNMLTETHKKQQQQIHDDNKKPNHSFKRKTSSFCNQQSG